MKFAAFSGVLIDYSIQEAMRMTHSLGFDGIEIAGREPHLTPDTSKARVKEMRMVAESLGLEIPVIASYVGGFSTASDVDCEAQYQAFLHMLEHATELGATQLRLAPGGPNAFLAQEYHYAKAAYWIDRCAVEAKALNIDIVLEIHNGCLVETVDSCLRFSAMLASDNVGFIHDAGNMYITDTDYGRDSVLGLGKHLFHVHVKDERRTDNADQPGAFINLTRHGKEKFVPSRLGEGGANHEPLFAALAETGYDKWVTLECHAPFPPYERLAHDLQFVKKLLSI